MLCTHVQDVLVHELLLGVLLTMAHADWHHVSKLAAALQWLSVAALAYDDVSVHDHISPP